MRGQDASRNGMLAAGRDNLKQFFRTKPTFCIADNI
jgi:hypothetical protein